MNLKPTRRIALAAASAGFAAVALSGCLVADDTPQKIALAGSDTTQDVMGQIAALYNADASYNDDPDQLVNIKSIEVSPGVTVGSDVNCTTSITYQSPPDPGEVTAPNGSSAGRNALKASIQAGNDCIDVARSSAGPRAVPTDLASFEYYAFGLDAVGWSSASTLAPANITLDSLQKIYNCTFDNWSDLPGNAANVGPIERYWPQATSGTKAFFQDDVLGFDPLTFSTATCPLPTITQENTGELIDTNNDEQRALVPYSAANWIAQARGTVPVDQRHGQTIKSLNGQALVTFPGGVATLNTAGPVRESNVKLLDPTPAYPGIRYVWNVTDTNLTNYEQAQRYIGFENRENVESNGWAMSSPLCSGTYASTIQAYGFGPLDGTVDAQHNITGTTCRMWTPGDI